MPVTLTLPAVLARLADDRRRHDVTGATVGEAIGDAAGRFAALAARLRDAAGEPYAFVTIYLNDEDVRLGGGFSTPVRDGDEIVVVPAVAGG